MHFKKHFSLILAFLLLVSNSGLALNVHYCGGKIASVSSTFSKEEVCETPVKEEKPCCAKPDMQHKKCCSDKEVNLKNKTEKIVVKTIAFDLEAVEAVPTWLLKVYSPVTSNAPSNKIAYSFEAHAPPLYQLYCQYTLFG